MAGEGTVRGGFDLNTAPTRQQLRSLRTEAERTDRGVDKLGRSLDQLGSTKTKTTLASIRDDIRDVGTTTTETASVSKREWSGLTRHMAEQIGEQRTFIKGLRDDLRDLSHERSTPTIDLQGIAEATTQVEILERRLNSLSRRRITPTVSLGGAATTGAAARAASGGGGGGGGGLPGLPGLGGLAGGAGAAAIGVGLPAVQSLGGAAFAGASSIAGGALGLGALGFPAAGFAAGGAGGIAAGTIPLVKRLGAIKTAQDTLTLAIKHYGQASTQAARARKDLSRAEQQAPHGAAAFEQSFVRLGRRYNTALQPAQQNMLGTFQTGVRTAGALRGRVAGLSQRTTGALQREAQPFGRFLSGRFGSQATRASGAIFDENLGNSRRVMQNLLQTTVNLERAARPFFHDATDFLSTWTGGWRTSTGDIKGTRDTIRGFETDLRSVGRLGGATFDLIRDLMMPARQPGRSMIDDLTAQLRQWDQWVRRNPAQVRQFFTDTVSETEKIAGGIGSIVHLLNQFATLLRPILTMATQLATVTGSLGLGAPGLLGATYYGLRGAVGMPMGGGLGMFGRGGGGRGMPGTMGGGVAGGVAAGATGGSFFGGLRSRAQTLRTQGTTYGLARGLGRSPLAAGAAQAGTLGLAGAGVARAGLAAAGKAYLPIGATIAALQGASFQGDLSQKLQAAASSFTLGIIPMPQTAAQIRDAAVARAQQFVSQLPGGQPGATVGQQTAGLGSVQARINALRFPLGGRGAAAGKTTRLRRGLGPGQRASVAPTAADTAEMQALREQLAPLRAARFGQLQTHAGEFTGQEAAAFRVRKKGGQGTATAFGTTLDDVIGRIRQQGEIGAKVIDQNVLKWARAQAKGNPKMVAQVDALQAAIEKRFKGMGRNIDIVNGKILTGSTAQWQGIQTAITSPMVAAQQEVLGHFTAIQQQAVHALMMMGFDQSSAKGIVQGTTHGGQAGQVAAQDVAQGPTGAGQSRSQSDKRKARAHGLARGGSIGVGTRMSRDDVMIAPGHMAAHGEDVVNRHTRGRVDNILGVYGTSLRQEIAAETRDHGAPPKQFAKGGGVKLRGRGAAKQGVGASSGPASSHPELHPGIQAAANLLMGRFPGMSITSTTGGGHASGSYHYLGEAADIAGSQGLMDNAAKWAQSNMAQGLTEGIHNPGLSVKDNRVVSPSLYAAVWAEHRNHIHLAVAGAFNAGAAAGAAGAVRGGGGAAAIQQLGKLNAPGSRLGGVPGALSGKAGQAMAVGMQAAVNKRLRKRGAGAPGVATTTGGGINSWLTQALQITGHFSPQNLTELRGRAMQESSGNPNAINRTDSNAAAGHPSQGLLQTIPSTFAAYRVRSLPNNILDPVANAAAAINYMFARYGHIVGPSGSGYARGGTIGGASSRGVDFAGWHRNGIRARFNRPTLIGVGEGMGAEDVEVKRARRGFGGPGGATGAIGFGGHHVTAHVRIGRVVAGDAAEAGDKIGEHIAKKITKALADHERVSDQEVTG